MTQQYIQLYIVVINTLEASSLPLFAWFNSTTASTALIDGSSIESNTKEILLGITIDRDLKFDEHVNNLCKKACQKLNALVRLAPFMNVDKKRMIMKAFIESQFGYCPLVWIFHSRSLNNKINLINERALRITFNDKSSSFQNLLEKDNKFLRGLSPPLMNEIFAERNSNYSLRGNNVLTRRKVNSVRYGTETVSLLAPKIWDILPKDIKDSESLDMFKSKIKKWIPSKCPCRLCKAYVPQVGFI